MALLTGFIGIDRHRDPRIRDLKGAARDAKALWALFSDSLADLKSTPLVDADATLERVRTLFDETLGAATPDDVVLLSFSGHGTRDHRLVLTDTDFDDVSTTTMDMGELAERFRETKARAVIFLLDCCFSGGAPARVLDNGPILRDIGIDLGEIAGRGRLLFAAANVEEWAIEDPATRHGLFTKAIVDRLLEADTPQDVMALAAMVSRDVRAGAARFGYVQTPVIFGVVEGELTLPPLRKGRTYESIFPAPPTAVATPDFASLAPYGFDPAVLDVWADRYPNGLNQLQLTAINDHGVLRGESLLVVAPTSAGKTFVGEVAALRTIAEGQKAIFLLPYKAIVNEKYEEFTEIYGTRLGLRVVRCSGDWQDQVGEFLRGKYDIAFLTYEKFLGLSLAAPYVLHQIGLVVLDEAHFIMEEGRGMSVELLLTNLVSARERGIAPQLIALSAVIGDTNSFDRWLGTQLLIATDRPVPLVEGVLDRTGALRRLKDDQVEEDETFLPRHLIRVRRDKPSAQDVIVPLVRQLVEAGEKVIVFRNARGVAGGAAVYLGAELGLRPAEGVLSALPERDLSSTSQQLRRALQGGVAFHNSNLTREERAAIESAFRDPNGGVRVLVATTTVAAGVNTPASTVVIVEMDFFTGDGPKPFTVSQYKNMAGRAGRLGFEREGKAIVLSDTPMERNRLFRVYVEGTPEALRSSFDPRRPETWVIRLLAQVGRVTREQVLELVANTYGGFLAAMAEQGWRERIRPQIDALLDRMLAGGLLDLANDTIGLTILGRACAEAPLAFASTLQLVEVVRQVGPTAQQAETLMALLQALPEADADYTPMARGQFETQWPYAVRERFGDAVSAALYRNAPSDKVYYARCKRALVLKAWVDGVPISDIETAFSANAFSRVGHGDIRGFADATRFFLEPALRIAAIVHASTEPDSSEVDAFLKRLEIGLPADGLLLLALTSGLTRGDYLGLLGEGLRTPEEVATLPTERLEALVGRANAKSIKDRFDRSIATP